MKLSDFSLEEQNHILKALAEQLYVRGRVILITYGPADQHGNILLTDEDRLNNRLVLGLLIDHLGVPDHDAEVLSWIQEVLADTKGESK